MNHGIAFYIFQEQVLMELRRALSSLLYMKFIAVYLLSVSFVITWTVARQAPLSMAFLLQEYRSGLPFPYPGDLPDLNPGLKPASPELAGGFFAIKTLGKPELPG